MRISRLARIAVLLVSASLATASVGFRPWGGMTPVDAISREFSFGAGFGSRGEAISREVSFGAEFGSRGEAISREVSFGAGFGSRGEAISREFSFAVGSDLAFTHSIPSQGLINEVFHVTWTTRNYGRTVADGPWVDRLEFSTPMRLVSGGTVTQVPLDSPDSLSPGQSYQHSLSFLMPASPTTFSTRLTVDVNNQVIEATDFNNTTDWLPVEVIDIYRPNLTASITMQPPSGQAPSVVRAGDSVAIDFKVVNKGNVPTPAPLWTDRVYLVPADGGQAPTSTYGAVWSWPISSQGLLQPDPSGNGTVPGSAYTQAPDDLELPLTITGTYFLAVRVDASNSQLELNEDDNLVFSDPITVSPPLLPNLGVEGIGAMLSGSPILDGTNLQSGTQVQVGWTVRNHGSAPFAGGTVRADIWVSSDGVASGVGALDAATNLRLAQVNVQVIELGLGSAVDVTASIYLPLDVAILPGGGAPLRFKVSLDPAGQVWEEESQGSPPYWNNLAIGAFSHGVTQMATPDLEAQSIGMVAGQTARSGFPLTIEWNVAEPVGGGGWSAPFAWRDELWLSPCTGALDDPVTCNLVLGEGDDVLLASRSQSATQDSGGFWSVSGYPKTITVPLREDLSGSYRLILRTDANGNLFEQGGGELNNVVAGPVFTVDRMPADLSVTPGIVSSGLMPDTSGAPGDVLHLSWTVTNSAAAGPTSAEAWKDRVYLSDSSGSYVGGHLLIEVPRTRGLIAGDKYDVVVNATVPNVTPGAWHLHFVTDYHGVVFEDDDSNNRDTTGFQVTNAVADLVVDAVSAAQVLRSSEPVVVEWTVRNAGSAPTGASSWYDRVYFSDAADLSQATQLHILGSRFRGAPLGAGSSYTASASFAFPYGLTPGPWYVLVESDAGYHVFELDDANNDSSTASILEIAPPIPPTPPAPGEPDPEPTSQWIPANLVTRNVHAQTADVFAGQALEVSWEVTNEGAGVGNRSHWAETVYLSLDDNLEPGQDIYLGSLTNSAFIAVGETKVRTTNFIVPLPANGAWKLIVDADALGQVDQSGLTADDVAVSPGLIQVTPPPLTNLSVSDVDLPLAPAVTLLGEALDFEWTTLNDSLADVPAALSWTDRFWLVPQAASFPSADAIYLGEIRSSAGLIMANGGTHVQDAGNAFPPLLVPGVMPGDYRLAVQTDALLQIAETDEGEDNRFTSVGTLSLQAIDLPLGGSAQAELSNGSMRWFRLVAGADQTIDLEFEHADPSAHCEIFVSDGSLPVLGRYDLASDGPDAVDAFRQSVRIPRSSGNDYFILARTVHGAGRNAVATLAAIARDFALESVEPSHVGTGVVTIALQGAELWRASRVDLRESEGSGVIASATGPDQLIVLDDGTLLARFDLSAAPTGAVDIVAVDEASSQNRFLFGALEIEPALPLALRADLELAPSIRRGETGSGELVVRNLGNVDVPFGLVALGHLWPANAVDDEDRAILTSPAVNSVRIDSDVGRDGWALIVEDLAPGRSHRIPLDLIVGGAYADDSAPFTVAARGSSTDTYRGSSFVAWSRILRLALLSDPATPGQLTSVVQSFAAWNAAVAAAVAAGHIELEVSTMHSPSSPVRSARDVIEDIAAGLTAYLALPPGAEIPETAIDTAAASQVCWTFAGLAFDCDELFPEQCVTELSSGGATTVVGMPVPVANVCVSTPAPDDPNEKIRPPGVAPNSTVSASQPLQYEVHFENRETATAWASLVEIEDALQPGFNAASVRFHELRIGRTVIPFPPNTRSYLGQQELQIDEDTTMRVQISALVDLVTRVVTVRLQAIDPATGLPPVSGDRGLLAPSTPEMRRLATGYVILSASVKQSLEGSTAGVVISRSGHTETNSASIKMDSNPSLTTNTVSNQLDAVGPSSTLTATSMAGPLAGSYQLSWTATDVEQLALGEFPGTGVRSFSLYRGSSPDGPWTPLLADTTDDSFEFVPESAGRFWFRLEAIDGVGNVGEPSDVVEVLVPFDCNGNGVPDDVEIAAGDEFDCDGSGVPDSCELQDGTLTDSNLNGVPDICECVAAEFCDAVVNSTGQPAQIEVVGTPSLSGGVTLRVSGLPSGRTGQFFFSDGKASFPRGDGLQCLSGSQLPLSRVLRADAAGTVTFEIDFNLPQVIAGGLAPGATRYFQYWYRDAALQGGTGFNSSAGLQVTFCE